MSDLEKLFILQITLIPGLLLYAINDVKKLRKEFESLRNDVNQKLVGLETWRDEHTKHCSERHAQHRKSIDELRSRIFGGIHRRRDSRDEDDVSND